MTTWCLYFFVFCLFTCSKFNSSTDSKEHFLNSDIKTVFYLLKNVKTFSMRRKDTPNLALCESYSYEISKYCHLIKLGCRGWSKRGAHSSGPINQVLCCANRFHPNQSQKTARPQIRQILLSHCFTSWAFEIFSHLQFTTLTAVINPTHHLFIWLQGFQQFMSRDAFNFPDGLMWGFINSRLSRKTKNMQVLCKTDKIKWTEMPCKKAC